jgi:hypothetical protein
MQSTLDFADCAEKADQKLTTPPSGHVPPPMLVSLCISLGADHHSFRSFVFSAGSGGACNREDWGFRSIPPARKGW